MREHHALGASGGAGGEADRRERFLREVANFDVIVDRPQVSIRTQRAFLRIGPKHAQRRQFSAGDGHLAQRLRDARVLDDDEPGRGVADAPRDVFRIVVDIERHDDQAKAERRQVNRHPGGAVARAQPDAVTRHESLASERRLPPRDLRCQFANGDVLPSLAGEMAVDDMLRPVQMLREELRDVRHRSPYGCTRSPT